LDVAAAWGVPAHVTVLYPFVPPEVVDSIVLGRLRGAISTVTAFACTFSTTDWFGSEVVWVRPDPDEPFRALTRAVSSAFPQYPPYGGAHGADVVPHLTVGEARRADAARLRRAEAQVLADLPVSAFVTHAWLIEGTDADRSWHVVDELPLVGTGAG
jgi:2'-5' RNA ligase